MKNGLELARVRRYFSRFKGLPEIIWDYPDENHPYIYDGKVMRLHGDDYAMQMHDVIHWLVAPPERRGMVEFGLGPDTMHHSDAPCVVTEAEGDAEELLVCSVNVMLALHLELDAARLHEYLNLRLIERGHVRWMMNHRLVSRPRMNHLIYIAKMMRIPI